MTNYFYKRKLNQTIEGLLSYHLGRVKKSYLKKVQIRYSKDQVYRPNVSAFIQLNSKPKVILFQYPILRELAHNYLVNFLNDNVIDAIRHEFAHLKYRGESKDHRKWQKQIDLFKKDKKKL